MIRTTKADLQTHLTLEATLAPADVEAWAARLFTLERSIPIFEKQAHAAGVAYSEARTALSDAAIKAGAFHQRQAGDRVVTTEQEARAAIEAARHDLALVNAAVSKASSFKARLDSKGR